MTQKKADPFYTSPTWKSLRLAVLKRDHFHCVICGANVGARGAARVDHIKPRKTHRHLELEPANLLTLCARCDNQSHAEKGRGGEERIEKGCGADGWPFARNS